MENYNMENSPECLKSAKDIRWYYSSINESKSYSYYSSADWETKPVWLSILDFICISQEVPNFEAMSQFHNHLLATDEKWMLYDNNHRRR